MSDYRKKMTLLEELKCAQGKEGNLEYAREGDRGSRSFERDRDDLRDGFEFCGWNIKVAALKDGEVPESRYGDSADFDDSTFHPMFFCLNLTELFVFMDALLKSRKKFSLADDLIKMTMKQLSEYARKKITEKYPELKEVDFQDFELITRQESEIFKFDGSSVKLDYSTLKSLTIKERNLKVRTKDFKDYVGRLEVIENKIIVKSQDKDDVILTLDNLLEIRR